VSAPSVELRATYRLQLTSAFGFDAARALVPYLRDLGISHLYLSPSLQAHPGSTHGYDVIDPRRLSPALGGREGFERMSAAVRDAGMGIVLDVVPNHMAADDANPYWADPQLRERFFDVDPATGRHRRFFDIDDLAGVQQEDPTVFEETHACVLSLVQDGLVDGLRVDHPDGLADPLGYLTRLSEHGVRRVWVEKILQAGERLPDWPVCGTVGYEFLNDVCALFVNGDAEDDFTDLWVSISGDGRTFEEVAFECKLEQVRTTFAPEVERLMRERPGLDRDVLERQLASLHVYRTYEVSSDLFVTRFQQTTPAVMAKGVEDTAFYRYGRLLALNDVGGDPARFGLSIDHFHAANAERAERFPHGLLTTMTHDAKRSGDVRARIGALTWFADEWRDAVERWFSLTESLRSAGAPDSIERYFLFQTLVGAWPIERDRVETYMEKALREAKRNTNWISPDVGWDDAVKDFCRRLYEEKTFLDEFVPFAARVSRAGDRAALCQLVLKLTAPGIPDTYQGDELPFHALVDPDNRRPVDWRWREAMLRRLMGGSPPDDATYKLFLTMRLLGLRARRPRPFVGSYDPLDAGAGVCAFMRGGAVLVLVAVRPELGDATFDAPRGRWRDVLGGEEFSFGARQSVATLLGQRGFSVFERLGSPGTA
jgi:(1->4)-alpha-D-glucan 1-alpha-D-glucosylmutase